MNIDFELYRIFYVVANNKSITKASKELNISQPAVSKYIKSLEEQLGGTLFIRKKKGVLLTNEGAMFYNYVKQAIESIKSAENKFTELINLNYGNIKIGISTTLTMEILHSYLKQFHNLYPKIKIEIIVDFSTELFIKLKNGLIDIAFLNLENKIYDREIKIINCKKITDCFVVNKDFKKLLNKEITLKELNKYPLILQNKNSIARNFIDKIALENNVILKPNIELTSYSLVVGLTKIGFGVGHLIKEYIQKEINNKELYILNIKEKMPSRYFSIAISKKYLPNFSTKKLINIVIENTNIN